MGLCTKFRELLIYSFIMEEKHEDLFYTATYTHITVTFTSHFSHLSDNKYMNIKICVLPGIETYLVFLSLLYNLS